MTSDMNPSHANYRNQMDRESDAYQPVVNYNFRNGSDIEDDIAGERAAYAKLVAAGASATSVDRNFYSHELRESVRYRQLGWEVGQPADPTAAYRLWNNTHTATLEEYRILGPNTDKSLYHANAIKLMEGN